MEGKIGVEPTFLGFADRAVAIPAHFPEINTRCDVNVARQG